MCVCVSRPLVLLRRPTTILPAIIGGIMEGVPWNLINWRAIRSMLLIEFEMFVVYGYD